MTSKKTIGLTDAPESSVQAIKGFNLDLTCRGYQFEVGKTFKHEGLVEACAGGFHAIEGHPLEVFGYYAPGVSVYHDVEMRGPFSRESSDSKIAAAEITIKAEIRLPDLISRAIKYVFDRVTYEDGASASGYQGAAQASGEQGAAQASGYQGAAQASGDQGAAQASGYQGAAQASGEQGAAQASGYQGAAQASGTRGAAQASGEQGAAQASGYQGAAQASGYQGAAQASGEQGAAQASGEQGAAQASGYQGAAQASGYQGAAQASGYQGAAQASGTRGAAQASGYQGAAQVTGKSGSALASGFEGRVRGVDGTALFAVERGEWNGQGYPILSVACGIVGQGGLQPDVWYWAKDGKLVEVPAEDVE